MWTKRYFAVASLLVSALPAALSKDPSPKVPDSNGGFLSTDGFKDIFNSLTESLTGVLAPPSDKTSSDDVQNLYKNAIESLKKMKWNPCVQRLCQGGEMKVWNMQLSFPQKDIRMSVADLVSGPDNVGGLTIASVRFAFPGRMKLSGKFKYQGTAMMVSYTKVGDVEFEVGPVIITVKAKLPESKKALKQTSNKAECQYRMPPSGVVTEPNVRFEVFNVDYKSTTGTDYSKSSMIESFKKMKNDIIANVVANLESHVVQVAQKVVFSCLDAEAQQKWRSPGTSADCATETCD